MRSLSCLALLCLCVLTFAAAPPAPVPAAWHKLIDELGDGDDDVRKAAAKKLGHLGEDVIPVLRKSGKTHADADVRLYAIALAATLHAKTFAEVRRFVGSQDGVAAFALSPDGTKLVSGCWGGETEKVARVWDVKTGKELMQLKGHVGAITCLDWSRDGKRILTGSIDKSVRLWDAANGKLLRTMDDAHPRWLHAVLFAPDGKTALSCGNDKLIAEWDLETGKVKQRIEVHAAAVRSMAWMPCGKRIASTSFDTTLRIIQIDGGKQVKRFGKGHAPAAVWFVAVSPDGKRIATTGADGTVRLWDVELRDEVRVFKGHTQGVHGVAFSPDGKRLLTCAKSARLWDVETGEQLQQMIVPGRVTCVAFAGDDHAVLSCYDKTLRLWKVRK